jgi:hypothetical protein
MLSRPRTNSARLRHSESTLYAAAIASTSCRFHAASAALTLARAVSAVKGGSGGRAGSSADAALNTTLCRV